MPISNREKILGSSACNSISEITEFPAFTPVLSECIDFLDTLSTTRTVAPGELLIEQGRVADSISLIEVGLVKLVHINTHGREAMLGLRSAGWYAGYASAILQTPNAYSARVVTSCKVVRMPADEFVRSLREKPEMLRHFLSALSIETASQASLQAEVMSNSAEDRLEHFMRERAAHSSTHKTLDPLPALKQMELAQLLAVTPEHLSRMMKKRQRAARTQATLTHHAFA